MTSVLSTGHSHSSHPRLTSEWLTTRLRGPPHETALGHPIFRPLPGCRRAPYILFVNHPAENDLMPRKRLHSFLLIAALLLPPAAFPQQSTPEPVRARHAMVVTIHHDATD